jgi:hypothetical protein
MSGLQRGCSREGSGRPVVARQIPQSQELRPSLYCCRSHMRSPQHLARRGKPPSRRSDNSPKCLHPSPLLVAVPQSPIRTAPRNAGWLGESAQQTKGPGPPGLLPSQCKQRLLAVEFLGAQNISVLKAAFEGLGRRCIAVHGQLRIVGSVEIGQPNHVAHLVSPDVPHVKSR